LVEAAGLVLVEREDKTDAAANLALRWLGLIRGGQFLADGRTVCGVGAPSPDSPYRAEFHN
jgi:hypothetical protein